MSEVAPEANCDAFERQCPRLGGLVRFSYCCSADNGQRPCFKICDCWWEHFDVVGHLRARLSPEEFQQLSQARPPDKVASLIDLIAQAQRRVSGDA